MIGMCVRLASRRAGSGASGAAPLKKKRTDERSWRSTSGWAASPRTIGGTMKQTVALCPLDEREVLDHVEAGHGDLRRAEADRAGHEQVERIDVEVRQHVEKDVLAAH